MGLVRILLQAIIAGIGGLAIQQDGHDHEHSAFRQPLGHQGIPRQARQQTRKHLRRLVRIRQQDGEGLDLAAWLQHHPFTADPLERRPPHGPYLVTRGLGQRARVARPADDLHRPGRAPIPHADVTLQPLPVGRDRLIVSRRGRRVSLPKAPPLSLLSLDLPKQIAIPLCRRKPAKILGQVQRLDSYEGNAAGPGR